MLFKIMGEGEPVKVFLGGVHGREGEVTEVVLLRLIKNIKLIQGKLIICNLTKDGEYLSTLNKVYYESKIGMKLLEIIRSYKPSIYIELHSYSPENYEKLTDPQRRQKAGVPPLIELEQRVLIGSVSPLIRSSEFKINDLCLTLEIPRVNPPFDYVVSMLAMIANKTKEEVLRSFEARYPEQYKLMIKNFKEYFGIR
ncbi:MAG: DUF2119 family protein [Methanocellales archaeon]